MLRPSAQARGGQCALEELRNYEGISDDQGPVRLAEVTRSVDEYPNSLKEIQFSEGIYMGTYI